MCRIICFANQKGGVGKTASCVNLASSFHSKRKKVLLVDADPQGNATSGLGVDKSKTPGLYEMMLCDATAKETIISTPYCDVIPSNNSLSGALVELVNLEDREYYLKNILDPLRDAYDYILIDCPPSLGLLTLNALTAADSLLIPVQCEYYAMEGLADLLHSTRMLKKSFNPSLYTEGILLTMYDRRVSFSEQVVKEIRKYFKGAVFQTIIPRNVRIAEAPSHGKPINIYSPLSRGADAYDRLAMEIFKREKNKAVKNNG